MSMTLETHPVLGELHPHWTSEMFGSGYMEFRGAVSGLAKVIGAEVHILSVISQTPGVGFFKRFVGELKEHYEFIRFWSVVNDEIRPMLARYGFKQGNDVDQFGEMQEVWDWRRE